MGEKNSNTMLKLFPYLIIVIMALIIMDSKMQYGTLQEDYSTLAKQYVAKDGTVVDYNNVLELDIKNLKYQNDSLIDYFKNLKLNPKNVYNSTIIKETLRIDSIPYPIHLTDCKFDTTFRIDSIHYKWDTRITNKGFTLSNMEFPNQSTLVLGEKRDKWWKAKESIITVQNTNPYIQTTNIASYSFKKNGKQRWAFAIGGAILGSIATYNIMK